MLDYTFEIIEVYPERDQMMVKFMSPDKETVITGTPLPTEGMSLAEFVHPYAPIGYWLERTRKTFIPEVGHTGEFKVADALARQELEETRLQIQNVEPVLSEEQIEKLIATLKK